MNAILLALLAAVGFSGASLLALLGGELRAKWRSYSAAVAAGILLALAFVDLFPEGLELAGEAAIVGFVRAFASTLWDRLSWDWRYTISPTVSSWVSVPRPLRLPQGLSGLVSSCTRYRSGSRWPRSF